MAYTRFAVSWTVYSNTHFFREEHTQSFSISTPLHIAAAGPPPPPLQRSLPRGAYHVLGEGVPRARLRPVPGVLSQVTTHTRSIDETASSVLKSKNLLFSCALFITDQRDAAIDGDGVRIVVRAVGPGAGEVHCEREAERQDRQGCQRRRDCAA